MTKEKTFHSNKAPDPVGLYPHAKQYANLLFLSGVGPRAKNSLKIPGVELDEKGNIVSYDIEVQCHSVFENVKNILEASGVQWKDLIDVTVFLTNMKKDFPKFNKIWAEYFSEDPPCRTTIEVNALPTPIAIELKCIAVVRQTKQN